MAVDQLIEGYRRNPDARALKFAVHPSVCAAETRVGEVVVNATSTALLRSARSNQARMAGQADEAFNAEDLGDLGARSVADP